MLLQEIMELKFENSAFIVQMKWGWGREEKLISETLKKGLDLSMISSDLGKAKMI